MESGHCLLMEPNEKLVFKFVPNTTTSSNIYLKNVSNSNLAYKIKTNAPSSYFVRPSQGILSSGEQKEIQVIMQPSSEYPGSSNHKFLIQYAVCPLSTQANAGEINKFWDQNKSEKSLMSAKLSVEVTQDTEEKITKIEKTENILATENKHDTKEDIEQFKTTYQHPEPQKTSYNAIILVTVGIVLGFSILLVLNSGQ